MNNTIKKIIKNIASADVSHEVESLGDSIADVIFLKGKMAVAVGLEGRGVDILLPSDADSVEMQESLLQLTEIVAVLESFEKQRMIYIIEDESANSHFFYQDKQCFGKDQRSYTYFIGNEQYVIIQGDEVRVSHNDKTILKSVGVSISIALPLRRLLCSRVIPTQSLLDYIKRGFRTEEERNIKRSLKNSMLSMIIAVLIALFSPALSVLVANKCGISHIDQSQLDTLLATIRIVQEKQNEKEGKDCTLRITPKTLKYKENARK